MAGYTDRLKRLNSAYKKAKVSASKGGSFDLPRGRFQFEITKTTLITESKGSLCRGRARDSGNGKRVDWRGSG